MSASQQELDVDLNVLLEGHDTENVEAVLELRNTLWGELEDKRDLSQRRIFHTVLRLNNLEIYLVNEYEEDPANLPFRMRLNYYQGLERMVKHPKFDPNVLNFYAEQLARGLQQEEDRVQEYLKSRPPHRPPEDQTKHPPIEFGK